MFKISGFTVEKIVENLKGEVIDYGINLSGAPLEWRETTGIGINVGIIDTGIDLNHYDLKGRVKKYINFTSNDRRNVFDENGHGTHVSGIVAASRNNFGVIGTAPMCNLYIAKAFDKNGFGKDENVIKSINWMLENNVKIINMSFSSSSYNETYHRSIKKAYDNGVILVCAAGNIDSGRREYPSYPAKFNETLCVSAVDINAREAEFSGKSTKADISAAGYEILSCYPGNRFARLSGTSMATPIISGCAAILNSKAKKRKGRFLTPEEMRIVMCMYAFDTSSPGKSSNLGCGVFSFGRIHFSKKEVANLYLDSLK